MDDSLYREILMEYWENPRNYGVMKNADFDVSKLNPLCGDKVRIMANVKSGRIADIQFTCASCVVAKALASQLTVIAKGMKVKDFIKMRPEEFLATMEIDFSPVRMKCALLGYSTLKEELEKRV